MFYDFNTVRELFESFGILEWAVFGFAVLGFLVTFYKLLTLPVTLYRWLFGTKSYEDKLERLLDLKDSRFETLVAKINRDLLGRVDEANDRADTMINKAICSLEDAHARALDAFDRFITLGSDKYDTDESGFKADEPE